MRVAGGVTIDVFDIKLSKEHLQALPREVRPRLGNLLDAYMAIMGRYGQQDRQLELTPFWLPIRWTERDMQVEQVSHHCKLSYPQSLSQANRACAGCQAEHAA